VGYYVEVPGTSTNKAEKIIKIFNARIISQEQAEAFAEDPDKAVICVVVNPSFDAAAFCHNAAEFKRLTYRLDPRPKTWLVTDDRPLIEKVTGYAPEPVA
jgi:hypothetical protein